jgi:hypothetical protein
MIRFRVMGVGWRRSERGAPRRRRRARFDPSPTPATVRMSTVRHGLPALRAHSMNALLRSTGFPRDDRDAAPAFIMGMKGGRASCPNTALPEYADRHSAGLERLETDSTPATAPRSTVRHGPSAIRARRMYAPLRNSSLPMIRLSGDRQQCLSPLHALSGRCHSRNQYKSLRRRG